MKTTEKMNQNSIIKVKIILQTIDMIIEQSNMLEDKDSVLLSQNINEIIKEQKLFENIDMKRISSLKKNYIIIDEFKKSDIFYDILYEMFLSTIYQFSKNSEKENVNMVFFKTFNQVYFYKKFIKYMSQFIDKYQETLNDDIIKEKIFEIVHSLLSSEKIYLQDFYFYISMFTIHYYYPKNDVSFPEFEKFKVSNFVNEKMMHF